MMLSRRSFSAFGLGVLAMPDALHAQTAPSLRPSLVELFTSQGCSSCPPADALMLKLAADPAFIPITFATQIWDYLGWKDTFGKPAFTRRHRAYAAAVANRKVYTPQAIVNGRAHCVGSDLAAITRLRTNRPKPDMPAPFRIEARAADWAVSVGAELGGARLVLVPVTQRQKVEIGRGENTGRTVVYANVARDILDLGDLPFTEHKLTLSRADIAAKSADAFVLIAQAGSLDAPGAVLAAGFATANEARV